MKMSDSFDLFIVEPNEVPIWFCSADSAEAAEAIAKSHPNKQCEFLVVNQKTGKQVTLRKD